MIRIFIVFILLIGSHANGQEKVDVLDLSQEEITDISDAGLGMKSEKVVKPELTIEDIIEPSSDYRYSSFGKGDPFIRPSMDAALTEDEGTVNGVQIESAIPIVSPLQAFPLEQLTLKGVWVQQSGEARAVVMTPKKEGVIVKAGDPISAGKVLKIERNMMLVRQYSLEKDGSRQFKDLEMYLGTKQNLDKGMVRLRPGKKPVYEVATKDPIVPKTSAVPVGLPNTPAAPVGLPNTPATPIDPLDNPANQRVQEPIDIGDEVLNKAEGEVK